MAHPPPQQRGERSFSLLLVVFSVTAFWQSYAISGFTGLSTPGVFPMLASATMVVAAVCNFIRSLCRIHPATTDALNTRGVVQSVLPLRLIIVVLLVTGYVIVMPLIGFLFASAIFLFLSFVYLWRKSFVYSLLFTLGSVVLIHLIFRKLFQVVLPKGTLLQGWF